MKKFKIIFFYFSLLHYNTFAQNYILKSQNIYQKDNDNDDFLNQDLNYLHFDQVVDRVTRIRNKIYRYGNSVKRNKFYDNIIILMSKHYLKQIKRCTDDEQKKKIIAKYQLDLYRLKKNRDSKNLFQIIGIEEEKVDIDSTILTLKNKLYKNGFFDAVIETKTNVDGKNISIDYIVQKNKSYTIENYKIEESIDLLKNTDTSFIRVGENYKEKKFIKEQKRVYDLLKNSGYVFFKNQYINFFVTKDKDNKTVDVDLKFLTEDENCFKPFNFDTINIKLETGKDIKKAHPYKDVIYFNTGRYGKRILYRFIPFKKGDLYTVGKENTFVKNILQTEVFNNVYVSHELNEQKQLVSTIHLYPEKKIKTVTDVALKKQLNSNELINPYISETLYIKNFFRSLETVELSTSFFGNLYYDRRVILTPELQCNLSVSFPYFFPFLLLGDKKNEDLQIQTEFYVIWKKIFRSSDLLSYAASSTSDDDIILYDLKFKGEYNFTYKNHNWAFIFTPLNITTHQDKNRNKFNTYRSSKVKLHYLWDWDKDREKNASFLDNICEFGISNSKGLSVHDKYLKDVFTLKKTFEFPHKWTLANRLILGGIYLFRNPLVSKYQGIRSDIYFSVGGRTTVRGFDFESIGPGRSVSLYKKKRGEILMVFNHELRRKITRIIELAAFVDIGNIWNIRTYDEKEKFTWTFFKDLYIGVGGGVRLDFKIIVLSFDVGVPVRGPVKPTQNFIFHFGVTYPF